MAHDMFNFTHFHPEYFLLMGIPGLEDSHLLFSIPFSIMYFLSLLGNFIMILVISTNKSLHQPMYIFLMMLSITDVFFSSATVPKTLSIYWFGSHKISFIGCLTQVFFIHFNFGVESGILLTMAYDRYYAICHPLTYSTSITSSFIQKATILSIIRSFCTIASVVLLVNRLPFQQSNIIGHTYCEHMSVARLATADIMVNVVYGMVIVICLSGFDMILIIVSYTIIASAVLRLRSTEARSKAFNTCISHICVIILFYIPAFFSFIAHRIGHKHISQQFHIIFANLYVVVPPLMNPIIYGVRTKEIRQQTSAMFKRLKNGCLLGF
ncbi:olfactory receptor 52Z1P-like [Hyperolius riggenbachi]|uniref:olfactory receptor 52Z1P-like n=1 Tax=Hyperolius riggenbachi TaxID=752182 RepID=UPI0035A27441